MTYDTYNTMVKKFHELEIKIGETKGKEYSNSTDRLDNFKRIATELNISPSLVGLIYLTKHLDAIKFAIKNKHTLSESFESRILDARVYLLLIYALLEDELNKKS